MKEVLTDIEKRYNIRLQYSESLVKDVNVTYPTWRYRSGTEQTLTNILYPLDMVFEKTGENSYQISRFNYYQRPVEEGRIHLDQLLASYPTLQLWERRKSELRSCMLEKLELNPFPKKTPFNPIITPARKYDGYSVENISIETIPGVYLCGSLYKPAKGKGPFPLVLCPYGHFTNADTNLYGRYRPDMQYRCATLARMGAVVYNYDMFAWGESRLQFESELHRTGLANTMQTLNTIRAIDYLITLPFVDANKIAITGASGGGSQAFLATALDDRITVSVPVVMVSSYYYGGCPCESGMPVETCTGDQLTYNVEIAAMASPRPMLVISDGSDWTQHVPEIEYPYLQKVYSLYGKQENVENVHLAKEGHDYGISKRLAMYDFMARRLGLNINAVKDKSGKVDESKVTIEKYYKLLVFGKNGKMPENALHSSDDVWKRLKELQKDN
ncbi:MAG TPA: acetylxylan esterase [Bacteroidales bacterium]|nr:acetylxylan esterase [Bacteroidales bacterium]HRR94191.1 acetylxylan esterase [Bacteroidales bacterium]